MGSLRGLVCTGQVLGTRPIGSKESGEYDGVKGGYHEMRFFWWGESEAYSLGRAMERAPLLLHEPVGSKKQVCRSESPGNLSLDPLTLGVLREEKAPKGLVFLARQ